MPLGFVDLKDLLDLKVEAVVDLRKPVLNVLVYRCYEMERFRGVPLLVTIYF